MSLQIIKDGYGENTGVFVPMNDWNEIVKRHEDLGELISVAPSPKTKLSDLFGKLSDETAEAMQKHIAESRNEWGKD